MLSINTNISSIVAQRSMTTSTTKLNQAIERLSTGSKINHAADNAANYSIAKNMSTQLSACDVAADNISMGMDLLSTAQDTIAGMQDRGSRIHALITQARNGTYGTDSLNAMTQEANALVSEINRLYINTEYNGIKLFDGVELPDWAQEVKATAGTIDGKSLEQCAAEHNGFIAEVEEETPDVTVTDPTQLASAISSNTKIGIGNAQTLAKLAELVNSGTTCSGKTIILTNDIDLSDYQSGEGWEPIGNNTKKFQGTFNGNGHKVTGLYINKPTEGYQALFGNTTGEIRNVAVVEADVTGKNYTGVLVGSINNNIQNCYVSGSVTGNDFTGGMVGYASGVIAACHTKCDVVGKQRTGGLIGHADGIVRDCYTTQSVTGNGQVGGVIGWTAKSIINCYATGTITGLGYNTGGIVGRADAAITDCYATGDVFGTTSGAGGIAGRAVSISNSYATGNVSANTTIGGLAGCLYMPIESNNIAVFSTGTVSGSAQVGSLIGAIMNTSNGTSFSAITLKNAAARQGDAMIGFEGNSSGTAYESGQMESWLENITAIEGSETTLQVGINSDSDSQISVDTSLSFSLDVSDLTSDSAYNSITSFLNQLSNKATELGAAQNRLDSALESTLVQMDNLTSSLSTIRDADISEVSSDFIRQQILQQACATLMSTANQSPSIALQLL